MKKTLVLFLLFVTFFIYTKEITIKIIDKDLGIALEGVKVILKSNNNTYISDENGLVVIKIDDILSPYNLTFISPGYENKKISITEIENTTIVKMSIDIIIEGNELVIEGQKESNSNDLGVSTIIDKNKLKSSAMTGMGEDVMNAIKILPGVSSGGMSFGMMGGGPGRQGGSSNNLSIRGGETDGLTSILDGFVIRYPYQWNGTYSIFTPNVVDSVKFSSGIFSSKYGMATDALMEVSTIQPNQGFKFSSMVSLTDGEIYLQIPLWKNSGLLIGGRFIYYDLISLMQGRMNINNTNTNQYLRDAYFKWFWKPNEKIEWYINGVFAGDGKNSQTKEQDTSKFIVNKFNMDYYNYDTFWNMGFKIFPNENVYINFFAGYELLLQGNEGTNGNEGTQKYSDSFKSYYNALRILNPSLPDISGKESYTINTVSTSKSETTLHSVQTRGDFDFILHNTVLMSVGGGGIFDFTKSSSTGKMWQVIMDRTDGIQKYTKQSYTNDAEDKKMLKTFLYTNFNFNIIPDTFKIETGLRVDHYLLFGSDYSINTYPTLSPRFNLIFTPVKNLNILEKLSISVGTGLFSKAPDISNITKEMGLKDFDISISQTLTSVIGIEMQFPFDLSFKLEGYFKYIFNRSYINSGNTGNDMKYYIHNNGIGLVGGFDMTLEKSFSKWIDGSITYSFVYTRLLNPSTDDLDKTSNISSEPVGSWYYPSYHKFHNFNILLNIKPTNWCTITPKYLLSSGTPQNKVTSTTQEYSFALLQDGQVAEMYNTLIKSQYDDETRNDLNMQFDLKISFGSFFPKSKCKWEVFASVENLFGFLYSAKTGTSSFNLFSGQSQTSSSSNNNIQIPIPNFGIKISF